MRAVGVEELGHVPFVRHHLDPSSVRGAWVAGDAVVVEGGRTPSGAPGEVVWAFGPVPDLRPLLAAVADEVAAPWRLSVPLGGAAAVPDAWPVGPAHHWHWMLTRTAPPATDLDVVEVSDADEIDALLDAAAPDSHARPGTPAVETWLGVREAARLVAVGALLRQPDGTGHLRAVAVLDEARGRGLGSGVSAALTARALRRTGVATLGVYTDNDPALRVYRRLGYEVTHSFTSGPVNGSSSTTAAAPSR